MALLPRWGAIVNIEGGLPVVHAEGNEVSTSNAGAALKDARVLGELRHVDHRFDSNHVFEIAHPSCAASFESQSLWERTTSAKQFCRVAKCCAPHGPRHRRSPDRIRRTDRVHCSRSTEPAEIPEMSNVETRQGSLCLVLTAEEEDSEAEAEHLILGVTNGVHLPVRATMCDGGRRRRRSRWMQEEMYNGERRERDGPRGAALCQRGAVAWQRARTSYPLGRRTRALRLS